MSSDCPECGLFFEVDANGNFVDHLIAFNGEPCSTTTAEAVAR